MLINNIQGTDEYGSLVTYLFERESWLKAGLTYSDEGRYVGSNVFKFPKATLGKVVKPKKVGSKFDHESVSNDYVTLNATNDFSQSMQIESAEAVSLNYDLIASKLVEQIDTINNSREATALAVLVDSGTVLDDKQPIASGNALEVYDNAKILAKENKAKVDICLCSIEYFTSLKREIGARYTPVTNDTIAYTGEIGIYDGVLFISCDLLTGNSGDVYTYMDETSNAQEVDCSDVDFVLYQSRHLHIKDLLNNIRQITDQDFDGVALQTHLINGTVLDDSKCAYIKKHA